MSIYSSLVPRWRGISADDAAPRAVRRAFVPSPRLELVSVLLTTFLEDDYNRTETPLAARIRALIAQVRDERFVAQAALYTRHQAALRSVPHLGAGAPNAGELAGADRAQPDVESAAPVGADWVALVRERKLGYLALLRHASNILAHAPEVAAELATQLSDAAAVGQSRSSPFSFLKPVEQLRRDNPSGATQVLRALSIAIDHSLANVPKFGGSTLVALHIGSAIHARSRALGTLFAATLLKSSGADLVLFGDDARYIALNRRDPALAISEAIPLAYGGGSVANFSAIFQRASRAYDRVVILSDRPGWSAEDGPLVAFDDYKRRYAVTPRVYSFDRQGTGSVRFPQERVYCLAGWDERLFEVLQRLDRDPVDLLREVEAVSLPA